MIKTRCTGASKLDCERMYTGFLSISAIQDHHFCHLCWSRVFSAARLPICILKIMKATLWISFSGSGSSGHSIYEIGRKMPSDGFSLWSGSLASDWCLRCPHFLAVGRVTRSTYTPSVPMSLQVLVADFAVAKKSLKGNFHFPFGGQPWTANMDKLMLKQCFWRVSCSLLWKKNVANVNLADVLGTAGSHSAAKAEMMAINFPSPAINDHKMTSGSAGAISDPMSPPNPCILQWIRCFTIGKFPYKSCSNLPDLLWYCHKRLYLWDIFPVQSMGALRPLPQAMTLGISSPSGLMMGSSAGVSWLEGSFLSNCSHP